MADQKTREIRPDQKTVILGYVGIAELADLPEWQAYDAAKGIPEISRTKAALKAYFKQQYIDAYPEGVKADPTMVELPDNAVVDFIKYDDRYQVSWNVEATRKGTKGKGRGKNLTHMFVPKSAPATKLRTKLGGGQ